MFLPFSRSESLSRKEQSEWSAIIYIVDEQTDSRPTNYPGAILSMGRMILHTKGADSRGAPSLN